MVLRNSQLYPIGQANQKGNRNLRTVGRTPADLLQENLIALRLVVLVREGFKASGNF